jgi:hypothetical protein
MMDPIGQGLERFDQTGRDRSAKLGAALDENGRLFALDAGSGPDFKGPVALGKLLAASPDYVTCMARQGFRFAFEREEGKLDGGQDAPVARQRADACIVGGLDRALQQSNGDFREVIVALTRFDSFRYFR